MPPPVARSRSRGGGGSAANAAPECEGSTTGSAGARTCSILARRSLVLDADEHDGTINDWSSPTPQVTRGSDADADADPDADADADADADTDADADADIRAPRRTTPTPLC